MNNFGFLALAVMLTSIGVADRPASNFKSIIDRIVVRNFPMLDYGDLAFDPDLNNLSVQGKDNLQASLDLISNPNASFEEKVVSIALMCKLPPESYIVFMEKLFYLYRSGRISEGLLEMGWFPHRPFHEIIVDNYNLPSERVLLSKMIVCHCLSKRNSQWLFRILTGSAHRESVAFDRNCCPPYDPAPSETHPH